MRLNTLKPAAKSRQSRKRVGRGIGSGKGKTCGRGHKGQGSRAGGYHKVGFEGGQMPLQRRLPKIGFVSKKSKYTAELRLSELVKIDAETIDLKALQDANLVPIFAKRVKVIVSGELNRPVNLKGISVTKGARAAIEALGGKIN